VQRGKKEGDACEKMKKGVAGKRKERVIKTARQQCCNADYRSRCRHIEDQLVVAAATRHRSLMALRAADEWRGARHDSDALWR